MVNFIEQAREEARAEGEARRKAGAVLQLLTRKFGDVPEDVRARVLGADLDSLTLWIDRVLTVSSMSDVFQDDAAPS